MRNRSCLLTEVSHINVLVRFLTADDPAQFRRARKIIEAGAVFVPKTVLLETEWVLRYYYKEPKEKIVQFFEELLLINDLLTENKANVKYSLNLYNNSQQVNFTDCIIIKQIQNQTPNFLTFDKHLENLFKST